MSWRRRDSTASLFGGAYSLPCRPDQDAGQVHVAAFMAGASLATAFGAAAVCWPRPCLTAPPSAPAPAPAQVPERKTNAALRLPISGIYKIKGVGDVLAGRVEQGIVKPGDEVIFMPTHTAANKCEGKVRGAAGRGAACCLGAGCAVLLPPQFYCVRDAGCCAMQAPACALLRTSLVPSPALTRS